MSEATPDHGLDVETDLALERALEAAQLRAGDAVSGSSVMVVGPWDPSAVEAGDVSAGADGD